MNFQTFSTQILSNDQTKIVNMINDTLSTTSHEYLQTYNDKYDYDEDTDEWEHYDVYRWFLINDWFSNMLEYDGDVVFTEYKGQRWLGITCGNCCMSMDISVNNFMKKFKDFKKN